MKNVKKEFIFNLLGGDGNTDCIIKTNIGQFKGDSYFNHEADKGEPLAMYLYGKTKYEGDKYIIDKKK